MVIKQSVTNSWYSMMIVYLPSMFNKEDKDRGGRGGE